MRKPIFKNCWNEEIRRLYEHDLEEIWDSNIHPWIYNAYQKRLKKIVSIIVKSINKNNLILDIGSAQATIPLILAEIGYKVLVNDIRHDFLKYAKLRYEKGEIYFIAGNYESLIFKKKFDLITALEVIEHVPYPDNFLRKIYNDLNKRGILIITTPNGNFIRNKLPSYSSIKGKVIQKDFIYSADGDRHFFAFRTSEITKLLMNNGFKIKRFYFINSFLILGHMKTKFLYKIFSKKIISFLDKLMTTSTILKRYLSENFLIICEKD